MSSTHELADGTFYRRTLSQFRDQQLFPNDLSRGEVNRFARIARSKEERDRERIAALVTSGSGCKALKAQKIYIRSFHARYVAASAKTHVSGGDPLERFPIVTARAGLIGFGAEPGEMRLRKVEKARGGFRIIGSFRPTDLAQQRLLANALLPFFGDHPGQYGQRGKDLAVETLRTHVELAGPDAVFLQGDVYQFYDHVSPDWARDNVPMPSSLAQWMFPSGYSLVPMVCRRQARRITREETERMARRGLPQGSALSPFIAELVIARIIAEVDPLPSCPLVNYSDNFGLVCPAGEAQRLQGTLREGFRSHPAGPFDIRFTTRTLDRECRFGGYSFTRGEDGRCNFWVRETDWIGRFAYFADKLQNEPLGRAKRNIERGTAYFRAWPAWPGRHGPRRQWESHVVRVLRDRGWEHLIPAGFATPEEVDTVSLVDLERIEATRSGDPNASPENDPADADGVPEEV